MARAALNEQRFWVQVHKTRSCWLWTGTLVPSGHGTCYFRGKSMLASRASWVMAYGEILPGLLVCHKPKCPNKACVRPSHLYLGTQGDNWRDGNRIPYGTGADRTPAFHRAHTLEEAFWRHVTRGEPDACWLWEGATDTNEGYGQVKFRRKRYIAHRLSYFLATGDDAIGQLIRHRCPTGSNRACVNPAHLLPGTNIENMRDMVEEGTQARGMRIKQSKLTDAEVLQIRTLGQTRSAEAIAPLFNISNVMARKILDGVWWRHLLPDDYCPPPKHIRGELRYNAKLCPDDVRHIRTLASTHTQHAIAQMFHVCVQTVNFIVHHKTWTHVD